MITHKDIRIGDKVLVAWEPFVVEKQVPQLWYLPERINDSALVVKWRVDDWCGVFVPSIDCDLVVDAKWLHKIY